MQRRWKTLKQYPDLFVGQRILCGVTALFWHMAKVSVTTRLLVQGVTCTFLHSCRWATSHIAFGWKLNMSRVCIELQSHCTILCSSALLGFPFRVGVSPSFGDAGISILEISQVSLSLLIVYALIICYQHLSQALSSCQDIHFTQGSILYGISADLHTHSASLLPCGHTFLHF